MICSRIVSGSHRTFLSLLICSRYSATSSFGAYHGMASVAFASLTPLQNMINRFLKFWCRALRSNSRSPFRRGETLHPRLDRSIDEALLDGISLVKVDREEAEDSLDTLQKPDELSLVMVVGLKPCYTGKRTVGGRVLRCMCK